jgi:drug/metabolite transporter (DMT)-like permease
MAVHLKLHPTQGKLGPSVALVVGVVAVSWAAILVRLADAPPLAIAFWRLALATIMLALPALWFSRRSPSESRPLLVIAAGLLLAIHFALWIGSLFLTSVASSVLLVSTQPMFAALATGPLLGEKTSRRTFVAIGFTLAGAVILAAGDVSATGGSKVLLGDAMALAAAGAAALYLVLGRRARSGGPLSVYLFKVNSVAALALLLVCMVARTQLIGFTARTWLTLTAMAAGPHLTGHGLLNYSVRFLPATTVNIALAGEPLLSTVYAVILLAEWPVLGFYGGALLIVTGLIVEYGGRRQVADSVT